MQLTIFTDYALRTLMFLASNPNRLCSVKEISEHYDISRNHLVKVVHKLVNLGHIVGKKGRGGGISLACSPQAIRVGDLVKQLEPSMNLVECFDKETNTCRVIKTCKLKHCLFDANEAFIKSLNHYTLQDVI